MGNQCLEILTDFILNFWKHFYCSTCSLYLGKYKGITICQSCDSPFNEADIEVYSIKKGDYFIFIPLQKQLEKSLSDSKLHSYLTNKNLQETLNSAVVSDVTTTALYKELINEHNLGSNDMCLTWNMDGIPVFTLSNFSIWLLQLSVNELPSHFWSKNVLLVGLWFGQKPNMNVFLYHLLKNVQG